MLYYNVKVSNAERIKFAVRGNLTLTQAREDAARLKSMGLLTPSTTVRSAFAPRTRPISRDEPKVHAHTQACMHTHARMNT